MIVIKMISCFFLVFFHTVDGIRDYSVFLNRGGNSVPKA